MIDSRIWQCVPQDILQEIFKWCPEQVLLAFSRTCSHFTGGHIRRAARECQYPDKPHLTFYTDIVNYMIASRDKFVIMINPEYTRISHTLYEYDDMLKMMYNDSAASHIDRLYFITFTFTHRYLMITEYEDEFDIDRIHDKSILSRPVVDDEDYLESVAIVDLSKFNIRFWKRGCMRYGGDTSGDVVFYAKNGKQLQEDEY
jgi:F-box domain